MTADRRAALVERVAMVIEQAENERVPDGFYTGSDLATSACSAYLATAAIDLIRAEVLEEAARVAEREGVYPELNIYNGGPEWYRHGRSIAAAIRALKEKQ